MNSQRTLLVFLVIVAAATVTMLFLRPKSAIAPTNTASTTNTNTALTNEAHIPAEILGIGKARDERRIADVGTIRTALEAFKAANENGVFPTDASEIVPTFLGTWPNDPLTNAPYEYTPIGSGPDSYEIEYVLEIGVEGYEAGQHFASPEGIATP